MVACDRVGLSGWQDAWPCAIPQSSRSTGGRRRPLDSAVFLRLSRDDFEGFLVRTLTIANRKGGCGKTTVAINLAATLGREGLRVLLIDLDPQAHCALGTAVPDEQIDLSILDCLLGQMQGEPVELSRITWQIAPNLDLAPSRANLATLEPRLGTDDGADVLLRNLLESNSGRYDYCIVDCPPHLGLLMRNGLRAADEVIIPIDTGFFALQGLTQQLLTIDELEGPAQRKPSVRILPNQYDVRTKLARETLAEVRKRFEGLVCETVLNFNTKLREGVSFGQPITEFAPTSMGARDFQRLAREVIAGHRPGKLTADILAHAERLATDADRLLATTTVLVGNAAPVGDATPSPAPKVDSDVSPAPVLATGAKPSPEPVEAALQPFTPPEITVGLVRKTPSREPAVKIQPAESMEATLSVTSSAGRSGSKSILEIDPAPAAEAPPRDQEKKPQPAAEAVPTSAPAPAVVARQAAPVAPPATHEQIDRKIEQIYGVRQEGETVIFRSRHPDASEIQLAGDFNDWMPHTTPMRKLTNGDFECRLRLPKGRYRYRLVVDGRWLHDVHNPVIETNEYGELNSVVEITR